MEEHPPIDYQAYLLRLWRASGETAWRVSLEDPHTRQTYHFPSLKRAVAFVEQRLDHNSAGPDEPPRSTAPEN